jgi:hypothetical protein
MVQEESIFEGSTLGKFIGFATRVLNPGKWINTITGKESLVEGNPIDNNIHYIFSKVKIPTGVLTGKELRKLDYLFIPFFSEKDDFLLSYIERLLYNEGIQITVLNLSERDDVALALPAEVMTINPSEIDKDFLTQQDLVIMSLDSYEKHFHLRKEWNIEALPTLVCTAGKG